MIIGNRNFDFTGKSYVMGILNVTPDSFSDGGQYQDPELALLRTGQMIREGAAIIDIGGESTRPGHEEISAEEELERVIPVIRAIKDHYDIPISLDTSKYVVAREGIEAGADMINDIWGLRKDEGQMAELLAAKQVPCCLMHNRLSDDYSDSDDFMSGFMADIDQILGIANRAGIRRDHIILDPGIGFGKNQQQNLMVMNHLSILQRYKLPILLGTSRKSMIGNVLGLPADRRQEGTLATTVIGRMAGVSVFRVHDVLPNVRALMMTDAIIKES